MDKKQKINENILLHLYIILPCQFAYTYITYITLFSFIIHQLVIIRRCQGREEVKEKEMCSRGMERDRGMYRSEEKCGVMKDIG